MPSLASFTPPAARTDRQLVLGHRGGDPSAFEEVVRRHRTVLLGRAGRMLGDPLSAEDVVQDALLRAHRAMGRLEGEVQLRAWLLRIVHNAALDELRRRRPPLEWRDAPALVVALPDPHAAAVGREELAQVVADVVALPHRQRTALVDHALAGLPHEELARRHGGTPRGSKALACRARTTLRSARTARLAA